MLTHEDGRSDLEIPPTNMHSTRSSWSLDSASGYD